MKILLIKYVILVCFSIEKNAVSIYKLACVPLNIASVLRILCSKLREREAGTDSRARVRQLKQTRLNYM